MSIEESFEQLDNIIKTLENKDTSLEDAFKNYEEGIAIVKHCSEDLDTVEKKMITLGEENKEA